MGGSIRRWRFDNKDSRPGWALSTDSKLHNAVDKPPRYGITLKFLLEKEVW